MTETRFTWRWLFVVAGIGIVIGLVFGLIVGWAVTPATSSGVDVSALSAGDQNDYIVLVANSYAADDDLPRAKERLSMLKDSNINSRLEKLAKALDTRKDPSASNVASLAVAFGSQDSSLQVMAATIPSPGGSPTKFAELESEPSPTSQATQAATAAPSDTATATALPTDAPTKVSVLVATKAPPKATPKPVPTDAPPPAAPAPAPTIIPSLDQWWDSQYVPASVSAGQQYWQLKYARYCDWIPQGVHDPCGDLPGGSMDHTIYIMALDQSGGCANNPTIKISLNNGTVEEYGAGKAKTIPYPWYSSSCLTDWEKEMYGEGNTVSVEGFPSDTVTNMVMCSKIPPAGFNPPPCGHTHVRYFVVFQLATR